MNHADELREIQEKINLLHERQRILREGQATAYREKLKDLGWLKGRRVALQDDGLVAAGIPRFQLIFQAKESDSDLKLACLGAGGQINIWGEDKFYENNVVLRSFDRSYMGYNQYTLATSSVDALCEFIKASGVEVVMDPARKKLYGMLLGV